MTSVHGLISGWKLSHTCGKMVRLAAFECAGLTPCGMLCLAEDVTTLEPADGFQ